MTKKIAINGFGRIGRLTLRNLINNPNVEVVAINDLTDATTLAHLFEFDTAHRRFNGTVEVDGANIVINGKPIPTMALRNPEELPWRELGVDIVLECTGVFRTEEKAKMHITAGAKRVILSAPGKGGHIPAVVRGINESIIQDTDLVVSNASCTTNCLSPLVKILNDNWGIQHGVMSTIHAFTGDQRLQDAPHRDLRRARAASCNIVPTSTGAAKALALVIPEMKGKIAASSIRVPVITGSLVELTVVVEKEATVEAVNKAFENAANGDLKGILEYCTKPVVSSDIVSNKHSAIFDAELTTVHHGMVKVTAWYDNEAGYSARLAEMADKL